MRIGVFVCCLFAGLSARADERAKIAFFEKKIRPVLIARCYSCHSPKAKSIKSKLLVHTRAALRKGGESGPAVVPGKPDDSLLLDALSHDGLKMPPSGKLPDRVIADFRKWIIDGAIDPRKGGTGQPERTIDIAQGKKHWAFQRPRKHVVRGLRDPSWPLRKIDRFVLKKLETNGLQPSPAADRATWLRRAFFDAIGLPPSPAELKEFLADDSPDAYERMIDRLLSSPRYGERWARLWLDVARFAEDQAHIVGNNKSLFYPNAWLYRDWVIQALNADMPYTEFLTRQLAGDSLPRKDDRELVSLGFIGLGPKYYRRNSPAVMADEWEDRVDTISRGLLGITVACARCHDHKFDPITTRDYYALAGVFAGTKMVNQQPVLDGKRKGPAMHIVRDNKPRDLNVFVRGDVSAKGPVVKRRFLEVLSPGKPVPYSQGSGRVELAASITDRGNPLTARVIVNRVWALHFGTGLVKTPSNFGSLGERPSHPMLLDDLAVRFMEHGWSLKWLHREILLSATYRQSAGVSAAKDPENRWLARMSRKRMSVEQWRDAVLHVAGRTDSVIGGKSINPQSPDERRRTVYSSVSRFSLNPMLAVFDFPDPNAHSAKRAKTITPMQKLFVLNSPFVVRQGERLAGRIESFAKEDSARLRFAYRLLFSREPTSQESAMGLEYVRTASWANYAQILLATNEFLFLD